MPPKSEKQRRAMAAAASGKSTIGIPKKVGREYLASDPGGKLAKQAMGKDKKSKSGSLQKMFRKGSKRGS